MRRTWLSSNRNNNTPDNRNNNIGLRCAKTVASLPARAPRIASLHGRRERGGPQSTPPLRVIAARRDHEQCPRASAPGPPPDFQEVDDVLIASTRP